MTREPTYYTVGETVDELAAAGIKIGVDAVRSWARTGKMPSLKLPNGEYRVHPVVVEAIKRGDDPKRAWEAFLASPEGAGVAA